MTHYLINFSIYTMAMIGVIFAALFTFKTFSNGGFSKKSSSLNVVESMKLSTRKTLYVVKAGEEKFLIAADVDKTALISKLEGHSNPIKIQEPTEIKPKRTDKSLNLCSFDGIESAKDFSTDFSSVIDFNQERAKKGPMMRELAKKLSTM